jgi:dipeptidyl aminopeptidase/acylaminoacyl peptidase
MRKGVPGRFFLILGVCLAVAGCSTVPTELGDARREGALVLRDVPPVPEALVERLRQYQNTRSADLYGWAGRALLVGTRFGETSQVHRLKQAMGTREQITFFDEPILSAFTSPAHEDGFLYARDVGGSEFYQLFYFDWLTASHRLLTDGVSRYGSVVWSSSGDAFAYYTTERNGRSRDVHVQRLSDGHITVAVQEDEGAYSPLDFSPEDDRLLVSLYLSINESRLYEVDLASGERRPLLDEDLSVAIGKASYDGTGTGVYFTSDLGAEFVRLHHLDLSTGEIEVLTADVPWNVEEFVLSADGKRLALMINEYGFSRLVVWQLPGHRPLALPELPMGVVTGLQFSADGNNVALSLATPTAPADIWTLSLEARLLARWTKSEVGGLDPDGFVSPELVTYPTFDEVDGRQREVPAFVYRPPEEREGPHPVLIHVHGGPEAQYRPYFSPTFQYLVTELGMVVIAPNVRGSNGYGKTYLKLDNGFRREDSVRDIGALLDWIETQPDLDPDRVVVRGGSYGGYMVLASLVHYSDRLVAGIESVGISNFVTFLEHTQPYRQDLRRAEYGDERDPEMRAHLEAISPLNQVDRISRPLLISQGANDPRVPASESDQIFAALKAEGIPVWYVLAEDEGHGFRKKINRDYNTAVMSLFLERFVLPDASEASPVRERPEYVIH